MNKLWTWVNNNGSLIVTNVPAKYKTLILSKTGRRRYGKLLYYPLNFSLKNKSNSFLKNKVYFLKSTLKSLVLQTQLIKDCQNCWLHENKS